jgi:adenosylcobinamide-GDP ribazoletransferase
MKWGWGLSRKTALRGIFAILPAGLTSAWLRQRMRSGWWYQVLESKLNDQIILGYALFLSRLPVPDRWSQGLEIDRYVRGIVTFPLVGALLGGLSGLVFLAVQSWCGLPLAALFSILALALLTGGFHLDGLADTCDGVFSARRRERMLEIMRDSRLGTHGGLALIFVLLAKVLVVSELALRGTSVLAALAAACAAGRGVAVLLMYRHRYAREEGLGNVFIGKVSGRQTCVTLGVAAILAAMLLPGMHGVAALGIAVVAIFVLGQLLKRTLGGQTGDTLGAAIELGELIFLLALL